MTIDQFTFEQREAEQASQDERIDGYYVTTWDHELEKFTPQRGVNPGPYSLFGLRKPLRRLRQMGYEVHRAGAFCVKVEYIATTARVAERPSCHCPASRPTDDCTEAGSAGSGVLEGAK